jgi:hypothetical protein
MSLPGNNIAVNPSNKKSNGCWIILLEINRILLCFSEVSIQRLVKIIRFRGKKLLVNCIVLLLWTNKNLNYLCSQISESEMVSIVFKKVLMYFGARLLCVRGLRHRRSHVSDDFLLFDMMGRRSYLVCLWWLKYQEQVAKLQVALKDAEVLGVNKLPDETRLRAISQR